MARPAEPPAAATGKLKVFVSYSRAQVAFADQLELALEDKDHEVLIDRHSIAKGEDFQTRLGDMILACDTVVFILSDESAQSDICAWEVEEAQRLGKRMLVVTLGDIAPGIAPPAALAGIDWIHCWSNPKVPGSSLIKGVIELDQALRTDLGWMRRRTELQEQTKRWQGRGAGADSPHLLRADVLAEALEWAKAAPAGHEVPDEVSTFIAASEAHETKLKSKALAQARAVRTTALIGAGVAALFLVAAAAAGWFALRGFDQVAQQRAQIAEVNSNVIARESAAMFEEIGSGDMTGSLLMALYADPEGKAPGVDPKYAPKDGYASARARLTAAHEANGLTRLLQGHGDNFASAAFSPDGKFIVTGSVDRTARIWDAATGQPLRTLQGHEGQVYSAAFSPDGKFIVTGSHDRTARIWDAATGQPLRTLQGHEREVYSAAFSADSKWIVTGSRDRTARIWDAATGAEVRRLEGHGSWVRSAAFSADGKWIVTGSDDNTARIWNTETGAEVRRLEGHGGTVWSAAFSPDGKWIVTGSADRTARIWNTETGAEVRRLEGHGDAVRSAAVRTVDSHWGEVLSAAFSPDGKWIVTGSRDRTTRIWNAETGVEVRRLEGHGGAVNSATFSPDGKWIVTGASDFTAWIWNAETGETSRTLEGHWGLVTSAAFSPDGKWIVTGASDLTARIWNAETGETSRTLDRHWGRVLSAAFSPDGRQIVTGSADRLARIWNADIGESPRTLEGHEGDVQSAAFSPDGKWIVTSSGGTPGSSQSSDNTARIWNAESGAEVRRLEGHGDTVWSAAFSADGKWIVTGSEDKTARIWPFPEGGGETGVAVRTLEGHGSVVNSAAFSADGKWIVTGSDDNTARLWNAESGAEVRRLEGHENGVISAAFSPDGKWIVTGSYDNTARIWSAETGDEVRRLEGHRGLVTSAAFSPDRKYIVTSSADSTARIWAVPPILLADAPTQVKMACEKLASIPAPLAFSVADVASYPVLQGIAEDPANPGFLVSPCRGVLPDEAFARDP